MSPLREEKTMQDRLKSLVNEHSEWTSSFFKWVYKEAFIHGYKHGYDDAMKELL